MAEQWWADYSDGTVPAAVLKQHGYVGVIRYVTAPNLMNPPNRLQKHTTKAEFDEHRRAGLKQLLVYQGDTTDADSGFDGGVRNAQRAHVGCEYLGYDGLVFFTNDRTTVPHPRAWQAYLDGAASVLGLDRVGAYGFGNAMDLAIGHASAFWQAGRRRDVREHVNFWQDNNQQPIVRVGTRSVTTDRNLVLKPLGDNDMPLNDADLDNIYRTVWYGRPGEKLIDNRRPGMPGAWPETFLGSLEDRIIRQTLVPLREQVNQLTTLVAKQGNVTAADIAKALQAGLVAEVLPVLTEVVGDALGADNAEQAAEISEKVLDGLAERLAATPASAE
ncbi:glycoside hydrolase domain-containing protein [Prauserella flavalba]|uniref:Rv2525c-like glycoside hydrolase-like domain-containing protein n=1 Tax=Prauserella flavalba TaxID=1477506 RepID=A0A318LCB4_9PSEU|nr:glycoside hydrolase domain-containing protein [Prauserella flavalba]PXY17338.1 hypothetical protein BA062_37650 [Prauserella flavalba]